jgi:hypothetical protein
MGRAILNEQQVGEIKWLLLNTRKSHREIGKLYGVSLWAVHDIRQGRTWPNVKPIEPPP